MYDELGWRIWADAYRFCRRFGISPADVDRMELWQLAAVMNLDLTSPRDAILERMDREGDTLAERAAAMRGSRGDESDETSSDDPTDLTASIMRQMGIRTA